MAKSSELKREVLALPVVERVELVRWICQETIAVEADLRPAAVNDAGSEPENVPCAVDPAVIDAAVTDVRNTLESLRGRDRDRLLLELQLIVDAARHGWSPEEFIELRLECHRRAAELDSGVVQARTYEEVMESLREQVAHGTPSVAELMQEINRRDEEMTSGQIPGLSLAEFLEQSREDLRCILASTEDSART